MKQNITDEGDFKYYPVMIIRLLERTKPEGIAFDKGHFNYSKIAVENPIGIEHNAFHGVNSRIVRKYRHAGWPSIGGQALFQISDLR